MSTKNAREASQEQSAREYAAPRHDVRHVDRVDEMGKVSHRGIETTAWDVVARVTSAVMTAYAEQSRRDLSERSVFEVALAKMRTMYEPWFDTSAVEAETDVAGVAVKADVVNRRYWAGELNPNCRTISTTDYEDIKRVTVPLVGIVLDQVATQIVADRSAERRSGQEAIRDAVVREVVNRDLEPEDVDEGVQRALTQLHTEGYF
jgi:hypothetical protein